MVYFSSTSSSYGSSSSYIQLVLPSILLLQKKQTHRQQNTHCIANACAIHAWNRPYLSHTNQQTMKNTVGETDSEHVVHTYTYTHIDRHYYTDRQKHTRIQLVTPKQYMPTHIIHKYTQIHTNTHSHNSANHSNTVFSEEHVCVSYTCQGRSQSSGMGKAPNQVPTTQHMHIVRAIRTDSSLNSHCATMILKRENWRERERERARARERSYRVNEQTSERDTSRIASTSQKNQGEGGINKSEMMYKMKDEGRRRTKKQSAQTNEAKRCTHKHTHSFPLTHSLSLTYSLSLSQVHTHTHPPTHTPTPTQTDTKYTLTHSHNRTQQPQTQTQTHTPCIPS
jgi:hypothetical protein